MSSELINTQTEVWKKRVKSWQKDNLDSYINQIDAVGCLSMYLDKLHMCLVVELTNVS